MFIQNKYTNWYFSLVKRCKEQNRKKSKHGAYYEIHHIVPKCFGGSDDCDNLVLLTAREHFICHRLLTKMVEDKFDLKRMRYALFAMFRRAPQSKRNLRAKDYVHMREQLRDAQVGDLNYFYGKRYVGKANHFYGKKHSKESRKQMSRAQKEHFKTRPGTFLGLKHKESTKELIRKARSKPITVEFLDGRIVDFETGGDLGPFLGMSIHLGGKLNNSVGVHLWTKYGIKTIKEKKHASVEN